MNIFKSISRKKINRDHDIDAFQKLRYEKEERDNEIVEKKNRIICSVKPLLHS